MTTTDFDPDALHAKYLRERDKRLRADGLSQYVDLTGEYADYAADPNAVAETPRDTIVEDVDVLVIGGGISGLLTCVRLRDGGVRSLRVLEKAADFGGVWYWNRYPGVRCDVESYIYMPMLEETGYVPTEKYATGAEIMRHLQNVGRRYELYRDTLFQTKADTLVWDEQAGRWHVDTHRGDRISARYVVLGCGPFTQPKLPGIPGITDFAGHSFHTSRWDYGYTGGSADGGLSKLADKTVAVIGTGASAIQCVPRLAEAAQRVLVFQRTPSAVDVRDNRPTEDGWNSDTAPGWQRRRMLNFTTILLGIPQTEDLVADRWTDVWSRLAVWHSDESAELTPQVKARTMQLADFAKMEEIRARIDEVVGDTDTAQALKPWYNLFCKRPLYSDEFLQAFCRPNVELVDTDGKGVERVTADTVEANGTSYPVDCIIFATGFDAAALVYRTGDFTVVGRDGRTLNEKWAHGVRSLHGMYTHHFPNLFVIGSRSQASTTINVPHMLSEQAVHLSEIVLRCLRNGIRSVEVTEAAEQRWAETMAAKKVDRSTFETECTPGYFNNEGQRDRPTLFGATYGGGPLEFIALCETWRANGFDTDTSITYQPATVGATEPS